MARDENRRHGADHQARRGDESLPGGRNESAEGRDGGSEMDPIVQRRELETHDREMQSQRPGRPASDDGGD